jgi:hypothetical protein
MAALEGLEFDNTVLQCLPVDEEGSNEPRPVKGAIYSHVQVHRVIRSNPLHTTAGSSMGVPGHVCQQSFTAAAPAPAAAATVCEVALHSMAKPVLIPSIHQHETRSFLRTSYEHYHVCMLCPAAHSTG